MSSVFAGSPFDGADRKEILKAVVIAGLAAAVTKLVEWGLEEARERVRQSRTHDGGQDGGSDP